VGIIPKGVPTNVLPWARTVESRLDSLAAAVGRLGGKPGTADKTVYAESGAQNLSLGTNGKVSPSTAVALRYLSTSGLYEVTVSLAGLVRDGAIMGAGFESVDYPYQIDYDVPRYGVVAQAPVGQTAWKPFSASYSTVISARPGVQDLSLYLYGVCTVGANSAGFVNRARLSVKAV
jgi:hypothetical protein